MTEAERLRNEKLGVKIVNALKKRHFEAYYCATGEEAKEKALSLIPEGHVISWGGSETLSQIGLLQEMRSGRYSVIDRDTAQTPGGTCQSHEEGTLSRYVFGQQ